MFRSSEARCLYYGLVSCEPAELHDMNISEERLAEIEQEYITYCSWLRDVLFNVIET